MCKCENQEGDKEQPREKYEYVFQSKLRTAGLLYRLQKLDIRKLDLLCSSEIEQVHNYWDAQCEEAKKKLLK